MILTKKLLPLSLCVAMSAFALAACDDDSDDSGSKTPVERGEGFSPTCTPLDKMTPKPWDKTDKQSAAQQLVDFCLQPEYFTSNDFLKASENEQNIGANCFCYGNSCNYMGYERPEQTVIYGCDGVPETYNGAQRTCFRSSNVKGIKPAIYFPRGTCALAMSKCTADTENARKTICGFATFGDPKFDGSAYEENIDKFTSCPDGGVLLDFVMNIEIEDLGHKAKLDVRACFPGCTTDADCKGANVFDTGVQSQSQTHCVTAESDDKTQKAGVCFDMRSVEGTDGIHLIHPGKFAR